MRYLQISAFRISNHDFHYFDPFAAASLNLDQLLSLCQICYTHQKLFLIQVNWTSLNYIYVQNSVISLLHPYMHRTKILFFQMCCVCVEIEKNQAISFRSNKIIAYQTINDDRFTISAVQSSSDLIKMNDLNFLCVGRVIRTSER